MDVLVTNIKPLYFHCSETHMSKVVCLCDRTSVILLSFNLEDDRTKENREKIDSSREEQDSREFHMLYTAYNSKANMKNTVLDYHYSLSNANFPWYSCHSSY